MSALTPIMLMLVLLLALKLSAMPTQMLVMRMDQRDQLRNQHRDQLRNQHRKQLRNQHRDQLRKDQRDQLRNHQRDHNAKNNATQKRLKNALAVMPLGVVIMRKNVLDGLRVTMGL